MERVWLSAAPEAVVAVAHPQADCDLDAAVDDIVGLKFANAGQVCVSPQRVMVQAGVYEAFVAKAQAKAAQYALCSGDGEKEVAAALPATCGGSL